jgi:hypothetical protein
VGTPQPHDMMTSANSVDVLVAERQIYKPSWRGWVAVIALAVRIPEFDGTSAEPSPSNRS